MARSGAGHGDHLVLGLRHDEDLPRLPVQFPGQDGGIPIIVLRACLQLLGVVEDADRAQIGAEGGQSVG